MSSPSTCELSAPPRIRTAPPAAESYGPDAAALAAGYGLRPDGWQQLVLDDMLGLTIEGRWSASQEALSCPRQNGKNGIIEVRELFGMVGLGERILHTAHEVKTAREAGRARGRQRSSAADKLRRPRELSPLEHMTRAGVKDPRRWSL